MILPSSGHEQVMRGGLDELRQSRRRDNQPQDKDALDGRLCRRLGNWMLDWADWLTEE